ncbi:hypothetical protein GOBAR_DD35056 [Gossypium barbadense]|nr:hypothetical protein GOBAR_DD35056 [Gossypium barbadense]
MVKRKKEKGSYQEVLYGLLDAARFMEAKEMMGRMVFERVNPSFDSYKKSIHGNKNNTCDCSLLGGIAAEI